MGSTVNCWIAVIRKPAFWIESIICAVSLAWTACGLIMQQVQYFKVAVSSGPFLLLFGSGKKYSSSWNCSSGLKFIFWMENSHPRPKIHFPDKKFNSVLKKNIKIYIDYFWGLDYPVGLLLSRRSVHSVLYRILSVTSSQGSRSLGSGDFGIRRADQLPQSLGAIFPQELQNQETTRGQMLLYISENIANSVLLLLLRNFSRFSSRNSPQLVVALVLVQKLCIVLWQLHHLYVTYMEIVVGYKFQNFAHFVHCVGLYHGKSSKIKKSRFWRFSSYRER